MSLLDELGLPDPNNFEEYNINDLGQISQTKLINYPSVPPTNLPYFKMWVRSGNPYTIHPEVSSTESPTAPPQ